MKFKATLSCAVCGFANTVNVNTGFDCSSLVCPKCKNEDCLSITSVSETSPEDIFKKQSILRRLRMIQEL
jgi:hypothetical protein